MSVMVRGFNLVFKYLKVYTLKSFFDLVLNRFGLLRSSKKLIFLRDGTKLFIRPESDLVSQDSGVVSNVFCDDVYDLSGVEGGVVVDVGAHIGSFTVKASRVASKVICFEPCIDSFGLLLNNIDLNGCVNVSAHNLAVTKDGRRVHLEESARSVCNNIYGVDGILTNSVVLSRVFRVSLLKIDCEGAEFEILYGCDKAFFDKVDRIVLEHHLVKGESPFVLSRFLMSFGFEVDIGFGAGNNFMYATKNK